MPTPHLRFHLPLFALCLLLSPVYARAQAAPPQVERAAVVASAAQDRVRFAAPNRVARLRLEVLSASGEVVADVSTRGSVLDWPLASSDGGRLPDGAYLGVLTVKDVSGRISQRLTLVEVGAGAVTARPAAVSDLTAAQAEAVGPVEEGEGAGVAAGGGAEAPAAALLAHDGESGQLVTTSGDLSFRGGDFFTGRDRELMRLSRDGSLEVSGSLLARGGIRFSDGTVLESAGGLSARPGKGAKAGATALGDGNVAPSAVVNRLAKFSSSGGALSDSTIFEDAAGNVGVGTDAPGGVFDLKRASSSDILQRVWNSGAGGAKLRYVAGTGATSQMQFTDASGWLMSIAGNRNVGMQLRVRGAEANSEAGLDASARMTILGSGNVGVGTTAPASRLHVAGDVRLSGAGSGVIFPDGTKQTTATAGTGGGGGVSGSGTSGTVTLWTASDFIGNSVITQSNGNVGVGVATPGAQLHVRAANGGTKGLVVQAQPNPTAAALSVQESNGSTTWRVEAGGDHFAPLRGSRALTRPLPQDVNGYVEIGSLQVSTGSVIRVTVSLSEAGAVKHYVIPVTFGPSLRTSGAWYVVKPVAASDPTNGVDFDLDARADTYNLVLRVRRSAAGGTVEFHNTANIVITREGDSADVFVPTQATGTGTVAGYFLPTPIERELNELRQIVCSQHPTAPGCM